MATSGGQWRPFLSSGRTLTDVGGAPGAPEKSASAVRSFPSAPVLALKDRLGLLVVRFSDNNAGPAPEPGYGKVTGQQPAQ